MSIHFDFKYLQCHVLSNMISIYCLNAYASQQWDLGINVLNSIMWHGEKQWEKFGSYPVWLITISYQLFTIKYNIREETSKIYFEYYYDGENLIVNNVFKFALNNRRSVLGKNCTYLAFKYKIKCSSWYKNLLYINGCISDFVSHSYNQVVYNSRVPYTIILYF